MPHRCRMVRSISRRCEPVPDRPTLSVEIEGLNRGDTSVLGSIHLQVAPGEVVALVGPSGIGKTSLLRAVAGLGGRVQGRIDAPSRIAYVFQEPTLLPWRNVLANVVLPTGCSEAEAREFLAQVGLAGRGGDWPDALSLGQQRRLSLARAFAAQPDLLLLDEPFVSLDAELVEEMMTLLEDRLGASSTAALLVTHARPEAERLAHRIITLSGRPATVAAEQVLQPARAIG